MTTIYLIRHAEAEGNLYRRAHGQYDSNITQLGRRQVAALAERFRDIHIDALISSDLIRTQSTASAILKYHPDLELHTTPLLREVHMGVWEDRPWAELEREDPAQMSFYSNDPARWDVPGREAQSDVVARVEGALMEIAAAYPDKTVAVVSHGFAVRSLISHLTGTPYAELAFGDNTAVALLHAEDGRLRVEYFNDSTHLPESLSTFARQGLAGNHRGKKEDGWFQPLALPEEKDLYESCYSRTWLASHGNLTGYSPTVYLRSAALLAQTDPRCLVKLCYNGDLAGIIQLDPDRGRENAAGWISLLWVEEPFRSRRFGVQLLGYAVAYFRNKGREKLQLHVSRSNRAAIGFYEAAGFCKVGVTEGVGGILYLMEMDITRKVWQLP